MVRDINLNYDRDENNIDINFINSDIESDFTITSSVITQVFTLSRLKDYEQPDKFLQIGWIGNIFFDNFEAGCKFEYLLTQNNISQDITNSLVNEIKKALQFLFDLNLVLDISIDITIKNNSSSLLLNLTIIENSKNIIEINEEINI